MTRRIGILTSGGDCAGLNATIRAVALRAQHGYGWTTVGLRYGTLGLLERPVDAVTLDPARLDAALARQGGTFLGSTNRGDPFAFPQEGGGQIDRSREVIDGFRELQLDALIGIGGDGSLAGWASGISMRVNFWMCFQRRRMSSSLGCRAAC